jgi:hypothetical protein
MYCTYLLLGARGYNTIIQNAATRSCPIVIGQGCSSYVFFLLTGRCCLGCPAKTLFLFRLESKQTKHRAVSVTCWFVSWNYKIFVSDLEPKLSGPKTKLNGPKWRSTRQNKTNHSVTKRNNVKQIKKKIKISGGTVVGTMQYVFKWCRCVRVVSDFV